MELVSSLMQLLNWCKNYYHYVNSIRRNVIFHAYIRGPFAKFVNSPYYSELELCGGAVTVSFSKYLPWQTMHFLQCSTHFSKTCCRSLITSKFLGWKNPEIAWGEIWIEFSVRLGKSGSVEPPQNIRHTVQISQPKICGLLQPWKGSSEARNFEIINCLHHVFESVVRSASLANGGTSKKRLSPHPQNSDSE
jgi:hypothetical protein